jgi:hypothetical protein
MSDRERVGWRPGRITHLLGYEGAEAQRRTERWHNAIIERRAKVEGQDEGGEDSEALIENHRSGHCSRCTIASVVVHPVEHPSAPRSAASTASRSAFPRS